MGCQASKQQYAVTTASTTVVTTSSLTTTIKGATEQHPKDNNNNNNDNDNNNNNSYQQQQQSSDNNKEKACSNGVINGEGNSRVVNSGDDDNVVRASLTSNSSNTANDSSSDSTAVPAVVQGGKSSASTTADNNNDDNNVSNDNVTNNGSHQPRQQDEMTASSEAATTPLPTQEDHMMNNPRRKSWRLSIRKSITAIAAGSSDDNKSQSQSQQQQQQQQRRDSRRSSFRSRGSINKRSSRRGSSRRSTREPEISTRMLLIGDKAHSICRQLRFEASKCDFPSSLSALERRNRPLTHNVTPMELQEYVVTIRANLIQDIRQICIHMDTYKLYELFELELCTSTEERNALFCTEPRKRKLSSCTRRIWNKMREKYGEYPEFIDMYVNHTSRVGTSQSSSNGSSSSHPEEDDMGIKEAYEYLRQLLVLDAENKDTTTTKEESEKQQQEQQDEQDESQGQQQHEQREPQPSSEENVDNDNGTNGACDDDGVVVWDGVCESAGPIANADAKLFLQCWRIIRILCKSKLIRLLYLCHKPPFRLEVGNVFEHKRFFRDLSRVAAHDYHPTYDDTIMMRPIHDPNKTPYIHKERIFIDGIGIELYTAHNFVPYAPTWYGYFRYAEALAFVMPFDDDGPYSCTASSSNSSNNNNNASFEDVDYFTSFCSRPYLETVSYLMFLSKPDRFLERILKYDDQLYSPNFLGAGGVSMPSRSTVFSGHHSMSGSVSVATPTSAGRSVASRASSTASRPAFSTADQMAFMSFVRRFRHSHAAAFYDDYDTNDSFFHITSSKTTTPSFIIDSIQTILMTENLRRSGFLGLPSSSTSGRRGSDRQSFSHHHHHDASSASASVSSSTTATQAVVAAAAGVASSASAANRHTNGNPNRVFDDDETESESESSSIMVGSD